MRDTRASLLTTDILYVLFSRYHYLHFLTLPSEKYKIENILVIRNGPLVKTDKSISRNFMEILRVLFLSQIVTVICNHI
jgi:hypothetical protein